MKKLFAISCILMLTISCVSKKEYEALQKRNTSLSKKNKEIQRNMDAVLLEKEKYDAVFATYLFRIDSLQKVVNALQTQVPANSNTQIPAAKTKPMAKAAYGDWNKPEYNVANTALLSAYMSEEEKEFIKLWNYCRLNPQLFLNTYLKKIVDKAPQSRTKYEASLIIDLQKQSPLPVIRPDKVLFASAKCHAYNSGVVGHVGHNRKSYATNCPSIFRAECCSYGNLDALGHLINLLVDEGVASLGHRIALLTKYEFAGVSIQPHKTFTNNIVIDMHYSSQEK
jgi:hypothetical protein